MTEALFPGFALSRVQTSGGAEINVRTGGSGPPVLLLHGYPQTHAMWHKIAPELARHFTLVMTDLRGYGDSSGPEPLPDGSNYSFRAMAQDQVEVMEALGFDTFAIVAHDRGARTAHRLTLDHSRRVCALALVDIQPTHYAWTNMTAARLRSAWHWALMAQAHDIPEQLLCSAPRRWLLDKLLHMGKDGSHPFDARAYEEYLRCLTPTMIRASCADYRAFSTLDVEHDQKDQDAGHRIECPLLVMYGEKTYGRSDMEAIWRAYGGNPVCQMISDSGHYVAEEKPIETTTALLQFLDT